MPKSYRIRTQPGVDKSINIQLDQDFEYLEILSLKIFQNEIYTRMCSDYGVVVGRVLVNGGFGVPNAKVSVFIPITDEDEQNPVISELYPYKTIDDLNEDGYRYNLLPYEPSYTGHAATGTFPSREDVLKDAALVEVYDKYYKFTVKTNESGDYMIFGVPTGEQTIFMDVDLSDIGCFSLSPQDLINSGLATEAQVDGNKFRTSTNLRELPQVKTLNKIVQVQPLWGEPEICLLGITRVDFDLTASANVNIQPTAVFMGSVISTTNDDALKKSCKPKINTGNMCELVAGPGQILAIRQTINTDENGYPILEQYKIEEDGKIIDGDGTWLINLPMNLDYVTTNEFGEQVLSNDPNIGIPTTGKYRFKVKWQNEEGLQNNFMRGNYLIPNVKEHGWDSGNEDDDPFKDAASYTQSFGVTIDQAGGYQPFPVVLPRGGLFIVSFENTQQINILINGQPYTGSIDSIPLPNASQIVTFNAIPIDNTQDINIIITLYEEPLFNLLRSYAFSLDWDDYGDAGSPVGLQMLTEAINCEDRFYKFHYNKVYTVSSFIDRYKNGTNRARHLGIKEITNRTCQSENNKLPVNDLVRNFDFIFFLFSLLLLILSPMLVIIIIINHILALLYPIVVKVVNFVIKLVNGIIYGICKVVQALGGKKECKKESLEPMSEENPFKRLALPMLTYPDCEACACPDESLVTENSVADSWAAAALGVNVSLLSDLNGIQSYSDFNSTSQSFLTATSLPCGGSNLFFPPLPAGQIDQQLWDQGAQQLLSGNINQGANYYKVPMWQEYIVPNNEIFFRFSDGMTMAQSMNMANIRARYSDQTARNRVTITPNPTVVGPTTFGNGGNSYQDIAFITLADQGTLSQLEGKIIAFYNPDYVPDPNITGATENQFGGFAVTGTSSNSTIPYTLTYMDENGNNINANITVITTVDEKEYLFKSGIEYFQVVKGFTWGEILDPASPIYPQGNTTSAGVLWKYFLQNGITTLPQANGIIKPWQFFSQYEDQELLIMVRGVDPWTEKQEMRYDLSEIFGYNIGSNPDLIVEGEFFLNVPIQRNEGVNAYHYDQITPQTHATAFDNSNQYLFYPSFDFNIDVNAYTAFTTDAPQYYVSTDKSTTTYLHGNYDTVNMGSYYSPNGFVNSQNGNNLSWVSNPNNIFVELPIGRVDGGSFTINTSTLHFCYAGPTGGQPFVFQFGMTQYFDNITGRARCYSPAYYADGPNGYTPITTDINPSQRLVFRSDRLPTSDGLDTRGYMSFPLHQNDNFAFYTIDEEGQTDSFSAAGEGLAGLNDLDAFSELGTGATSTIVETFSCEGMVPLKCYAGLGTNFQVLDPCEANETGKNGQNKRVNGGCYYFVDDKLVKTIKDDIKFLAEWKVRFRIIFGACRGVFGHMFQNNWINGTLYMPTFNKQTVYNIVGTPDYRFCKDIVMFNDISNNFYYRCTPYADDIGEYIGGTTPQSTSLLSNILGPPQDDSTNTRQILFPTTIMDMGKRDEFISEICGDPDFSGKYLGKTFKSTSYQDSSDVLQVAILSRIVNSTFLEQVLSIKNGGIEQFFDVRSGDRIDGDIAQAFSINSEYQVNPFIGGNYPDEYIFIGGAGPDNEPVFGIFYNTSEEEYKNRRALSPGFNIYTFQTNPPLQTYVGYPDTQEVPFYRWFVNADNNIFGNGANEWQTNNNFYKRGYQDLDVVNDEYFKTTDMSATFPNIYYGFITNFAAPPAPPATPPDPAPAIFATPPVAVVGGGNGFLVGAPYHFYFGLKNGKTALNRFIKIYIETALD